MKQPKKPKPEGFPYEVVESPNEEEAKWWENHLRRLKIKCTTNRQKIIFSEEDRRLDENGNEVHGKTELKQKMVYTVFAERQIFNKSNSDAISEHNKKRNQKGPGSKKDKAK